MSEPRPGQRDDVLTRLVEPGVPLIVLAPHLDDAVLSCGTLMIRASGRAPVTVVTFFTEAGQPPYTMSARRYLRQAGARDAKALYQRRRTEDRAALEPIGITYMHTGLTEALFRRQPASAARSRLARLLPEAGHLYPVYRTHVVSGRIAAGDAGTLTAVRTVIRQMARSGPHLMLAPLGVGGHVDHVLVRAAAESSGARVAYYSDFPYNQHARVSDALIRRHRLVRAQLAEPDGVKEGLIRAYGSQLQSLFGGAGIPRVPEIFYYAPETLAHGTGGRPG
jgi:LmbE family N-acetylglucosaminyl deacetylase